MSRYYALTTTGAGWIVLAVADTRTAAEQAGYAAITGTDIYAETERKNLIVCTHTEMRRRFPNTLRGYEEGYAYAN